MFIIIGFGMLQMLDTKQNCSIRNYKQINQDDKNRSISEIIVPKYDQSTSSEAGVLEKQSTYYKRSPSLIDKYNPFAIYLHTFSIKKSKIFKTLEW